MENQNWTKNKIKLQHTYRVQKYIYILQSQRAIFPSYFLHFPTYLKKS